MAAVAVFSIYSSMTKSVATPLEETSDDAVSGIFDKTQEVLLESTEANGKNKSASKGSSKEKKR